MPWEALKKEVEENGNVLTVTLERLRDANGAQKLGKHVRSAISDTLAGMGLGHVPVRLPRHQHENVRIYKRGTEIGSFIEAVLRPGEDNDFRLREHVGNSGIDYAAIVEEIRELVG